LDLEHPATPEYLKKIETLKELQAQKELRKTTRLAVARKDYRTFAETCLRDESTGGLIKLAPIHKKWIEHIYFAWSNGLHAAILAPYGSGKTAQCSIGIPLFAFGQDPSLRIMLVSANDRIASERLVLIRQYIDHSDEYHDIFPHVRADEGMGWTKTNLYLKRLTYSKDASLSTCGATSSGIGKRSDVLIMDDVNDAKNTLHQPKMREVIWRNFTGVFLSRLEPGGRVLLIATRWHEMDLIGKILEDDSMRSQYAFLIQRISEDFRSIDCETIIPSKIPEGQFVQHRSELDTLFKMYENNVI